MNCSIGEYINNLTTHAEMTQAELAREINIPRQLLNCIISGKREMSLQLAMKLEAFFSLPDGELVKMQAMQAVKKRKQSIRIHLCEQLVAKNAFWSYDVKSFEAIPDEELIEKCFTTLDIDDINLMFELYPRKQIQQVWRNRMAIQGEYMQRLNVMIAMYYFGINEPEKYLAKVEKQHINKLLKNVSYAPGIND